MKKAGWIGKSMLGKNKERGFIIVVSYMLMASVLTLVFAFFFRSFNNLRASTNRADQLQAQYAAETGAERAIVYFRTNYPRSAPNLTSVCVDSSSGTNFYTNTSFGTATYTVRVTADCLRPKRVFRVSSKATQRRTGSTSTAGAILKEVRAIVVHQPITAYGSVIDRFDPGTYLTAANYFFGPFHVNGTVQIYGKPWFGNASYAASPFAMNNGSAAATSMPALQYLGCQTDQDGLTPLGVSQSGNLYLCTGAPDVNYAYTNFQLNRPRITFPQSSFVSSIRTQAGIYQFNQTACVLLDGTQMHFRTQTRCPMTPDLIGDSQTTTVSLVNNTGLYSQVNPGGSGGPNITVRGTLSKKMIIASTYDIAIDGDLTYTCTLNGGSTCGASDPLLALISARSIVVRGSDISYTDPVNGPSVVPAPKRVDGVMVTLGPPSTSVPAGSIYFQPTAVSGQNVFYVNGAIIMAKAEGLRSLNASNPSTLQPYISNGHTLYVNHDPRLNSIFPAYFPYALSVLSWEVCNGNCPTIAVDGNVTAETYPPSTVNFPLLTDTSSPPV